MPFDLVIRGGMVFDGTGAEGRIADVAIRDGVIAEVGNVSGRGRGDIDAKGLIVTPGFVDLHTHYDGQSIWSQTMDSSSAHGVTTVITGNCGVGFAPCRKEDHDLLIGFMEGVEDIPEIVMTKGLTWDWETFPQFLDAVASRPHDIDIGAYLPHSPLRVYVMGDRGARREPATAEDLARMRAVTREAMTAGAMGFATSSFTFHKSIKGEFIPSYQASESELHAIAAGIKDAGHGVLQIVSNPFHNTLEEARIPIDMIGRISRTVGIDITFSYGQMNDQADRWGPMLTWVDENQRDGAVLRPQIFPRPTGMMVGHNLSVNPFALCPSYAPLAKLPMPQRVIELRKPEVRARLITETPDDPTLPLYKLSRTYERMFEMSDPPNYEPPLETSVAAIARQRGVTPEDVAYDMMLKNDGNGILYVAIANYAAGNLDFVFPLAEHPSVLMGNSDGGAHYGLICDASYPTFMLAYLTRDRKGRKLSVPQVVQALSQVPANFVGLKDRGVIKPGYKADINVIDYDRLEARLPDVKFDLPGGGRRVNQDAVGYRYTIVSGEIIRKDDQPTGKLPGKLVRGGRHQAPARIAAE